MKLIFHIGAGKTGSTSIQRTLRENDALLKERGVWYLGLMLERVDTKLYEWQKTSSVVPEFHRLSDEEAQKQILDVLRPIIEEAKAKKIDTLIWSNESFLGGKHNFTGALQQLQKESVEVEILIYVREYGSWARSAYVQWGIKHKTYKGKLQTFKEWSKRHTPSFNKEIKNLLGIMPETVNVRNMSAVKDVVFDFFDFAKINSDSIKIFRDNDSPKNEELLFRALFNSKYNEEVLPVRFENIIGRNISFSTTPQMYLESLLPSQTDLEEVVINTFDDQNAINKLLEIEGQDQLKGIRASIKSNEINNDKMLLALADIVMQQSRRIDKLERLLQNIELKG
ncbi:MAG: hypothetical protein U9O64_06895 [Campylobacterota bacterium]|nr:hypothetical protein [Campylobacterota bacterium]